LVRRACKPIIDITILNFLGIFWEPPVTNLITARRAFNRNVILSIAPTCVEHTYCSLDFETFRSNHLQRVRRIIIILYTTGNATLYAMIGVDQMGLAACGLTGVHIRYIIKYYDSSGGGGYSHSGCRFAGQVYIYCTGHRYYTTRSAPSLHHDCYEFIILI